MNLYMQHVVVVRTENGDSEPGEIERGVDKDVYYLFFYSRFMQK